jgi:hypothetical protein
MCWFHVAAIACSAPCQKPASINLQKWFLSSTGRLNLGFILRENLPLCSSYLPLGVPNWAVSTTIKQRKKISARGFSHFQSFNFVIVCLLSLLYFCLHHFIKTTKN